MNLLSATSVSFVDGHETIMFQCENGDLFIMEILHAARRTLADIKRLGREKQKNMFSCRLHSIPPYGDWLWMGRDTVQRKDTSWTLKIAIIIIQKVDTFTRRHQPKSLTRTKSIEKLSLSMTRIKWSNHVPNSGHLTAASSCLFLFHLCACFHVFGKRPMNLLLFLHIYRKSLLYCACI